MTGAGPSLLGGLSLVGEPGNSSPAVAPQPLTERGSSLWSGGSRAQALSASVWPADLPCGRNLPQPGMELMSPRVVVDL